jgi:hypothetical protein
MQYVYPFPPTSSAYPTHLKVLFLSDTFPLTQSTIFLFFHIRTLIHCSFCWWTVSLPVSKSILAPFLPPHPSFPIVYLPTRFILKLLPFSLFLPGPPTFAILCALAYFLIHQPRSQLTCVESFLTTIRLKKTLPNHGEDISNCTEPMYYCYGNGIKGVIALRNKLIKKAFDSVAHEFM